MNRRECGAGRTIVIVHSCKSIQSLERAGIRALTRILDQDEVFVGELARAVAQRSFHV